MSLMSNKLSFKFQNDTLLWWGERDPPWISRRTLKATLSLMLNSVMLLTMSQILYFSLQLLWWFWERKTLTSIDTHPPPASHFQSHCEGLVYFHLSSMLVEVSRHCWRFWRWPDRQQVTLQLKCLTKRMKISYSCRRLRSFYFAWLTKKKSSKWLSIEFLSQCLMRCEGAELDDDKIKSLKRARLCSFKWKQNFEEEEEEKNIKASGVWLQKLLKIRPNY